ncbi:MAG: radical SAM protein [Lachnospiraceae bacterium]|nr:radical SAM protein [Lachnospiraceae bacterium]
MSSFNRLICTSSGRYYVYEGLTGKILTIHPSLYGDSFEKTEKQIRAFLYPKYLTAQERFDEVAWEYEFPQYLERINNRIPVLLLQTTCRCNLDCRYCVYSGNYSHVEPHADHDMSEEIMLQSIDFFAVKNEQAPDAVISFYGGEALLRFEVLQKAVKYARQRIQGKPLRFQISTNGMLLNGMVAQWLLENPDIQVMVTVNGPFQDRYRVTASGGGSLKLIMENLKVLREQYPGVWKDQIYFVANISQVSELEDLLLFYREQIRKAPYVITAIRSLDGNEVIREITEGSKEERERGLQKERRLSEEYCKTQDPYLYAWFREGMASVQNRLVSDDCGVGRIRSCLPGLGKLYVFSDGTFGLCESSCDRLRFGDVRHGFDKKALWQLYEGGKQLYRKKCCGCWAQRLCRICLALVINPDGTLMEEIPEETCMRMRSQALQDLERYCEIRSCDSRELPE